MTVAAKMTGQGLYRTKDGWFPGEDSVLLGSKGGLNVEITARDYRDLGYQPEFEDLPWEHSATLRECNATR
jgi:hypothetical protein